MFRRRTLLAASAAAVLVTVLAWWIKADWEMVWLVWMLVVPTVGGALGLLAALLFRVGPIVPFATGSTVGALALWAMIATPHRWEAAGKGRAEREARAIAESVTTVENAAREALGADVEVAGARPVVRGGGVEKLRFRFLPVLEPVEVVVEATFALGPAHPLAFRVRGGGMAPIPASLDSARAAPWTVAPAALAKRFDAHALSLAGSRDLPQGALVPLRLERAEDDWTLLVLRVGAPRGIEVLHELSRDASLIALRNAADRAGTPIRDARIYFTPRNTGVTYRPDGALDFIGLPVDRHAPVRLSARLEADTLAFEAGDWP